jgi:hypothetical protein
VHITTPFDDLLANASAGKTVTAEQLADIAPPPGPRPETWRAGTLVRLANVAAEYSAGEHGPARLAALRLSAEYTAAFGREGPPALAKPTPSDGVDENDPKALANLVRRPV